MQGNEPTSSGYHNSARFSALVTTTAHVSLISNKKYFCLENLQFEEVFANISSISNIVIFVTLIMTLDRMKAKNVIDCF